MKAPADPAKLQRAALYQLFNDLFWRGRQTSGNRKTSAATITIRKGGPLLVFGLLGFTMLIFTGRSLPPLIFATLVHAMTFVMVGMTLSASCSTLLLLKTSYALAISTARGATRS